MRIKLLGVLAAALFASTAFVSAASAETPWERAHPRQDQVLDRAHHQLHRINEERREGDLTGKQARRLRVADHRIIREDHVLARVNGGYITKGEQRALNHQEGRVGGRLPS